MSNAKAKSDGWDVGGAWELSWRKCRVWDGDDALAGEGRHLGRNWEEVRVLDTGKEQLSRLRHKAGFSSIEFIVQML